MKQLSVICLGYPKLAGGSITEFNNARTKVTGLGKVTLKGSAHLG